MKLLVFNQRREGAFELMISSDQYEPRREHRHWFQEKEQRAYRSPGASVAKGFGIACWINFLIAIRAKKIPGKMRQKLR